MQTLKDSELRYRRLFEAAQDGILILDARTGMIEDVNLFLIKMLGYSRKEFIKKKLWEVGAFQDVEASKEAFQALQKKKYIRYEDLPLKAKDGRLIQVEFVSNVYLVGDEKVIQCNIRDITARKRAEGALRNSESSYEAVLQSTADGILATGNEGQPLQANDRFTEMWQIPQAVLDSKDEIAVLQYILDQLSDPKSFLDKAQELYTSKEESFDTLYLKDGRIFERFSRPLMYGTEIQGRVWSFRDITARKQAEIMLREMHEKLQKIFDSSPDAIYEIDLNGMISECNQTTVNLHGYSTKAELLGTSGFNLVVESERQRAMELLGELVSRGTMHGVELTMLRRDGSQFAAETAGSVLQDSSGKPTGLVVITTDITERKKAEEALRESEKKYQILAEISPVGIFKTDTQGITTYVNPRWSQISGMPAEAALGNGWLGGVYLEDREKLSDDWKKATHAQITSSIEYRFVRPDGSIAWVLGQATPEKDTKNQVVGYIGTITDITELKKIQEELAASESELRTLFAAMTDAVIVYDTDGRYIKIAPTNPYNLYRLPDDMLGKTVHEILPKEQADYIVAKIGEAIQTSQVVTGEYALQIGGKEIWFASTASRLSENTVIWVTHDITERKRADEKIQRQLEHLTALSAIDRIVSSNFDVKLSLSEILAHMTKQLGVDAADILIFNPGLQVLEFCVERGFRTTAIRKGQVRLGESFAGRAALERQLIQIPNLGEERDNLFLKTHLSGEDFVCYFGVPLIVKGQIKGVLEVFHRAALEPDAEWLGFLETLAGQAAIAIDNASLFESLQRSKLELSLAYDATIEGWSRALDLRDKETEGHTQRVTEMTMNLARAFGLSEAELVDVRRGALLHDIGKMGVPDGILLKPDPLTDEEWVAMKKHPTFAYEMFSPIRFLRLALDIPYCHHEKWDGSGYPRGLKGEQIPLVARIFAVVDVWDALTSDRPYRPAWTKEKAREHIRTASGTHFDPQVVDLFLHTI